MEDCIKVFPWTNRGEFKRVFKELYSNKKSLQKHALDRIEVWKTRVSKLPVAVDSTAQLVRYSIQDLGEVDRTQALGFMIMKFVNNITEEKQQKFYKKRIVHIGAEMGIDRWIVNLRHQIAHGDMPSIHLLQAAVKWSLNWLKINFWEIQAQEPENPDFPVEERLTVLRDLLDDYLNQTYKHLATEDRAVNDVRLLSQIEKSMFGLGDYSFTVLVDSGYLICTEEALSKISLNYEDILEETSGLPYMVFNLWKPVLTIMDKIGLIPNLLLHMVSVLTQEPSYKNRCVYGWLYAILVHRDEWMSGLPYRQLLEIAVQVTNQHAMPVLLLLIDLVDEGLLSKAKKVALVSKLERFYMALDTKGSSDQSEGNSVDTVETPNVKKGIWTKCFDQVDWSMYPIGLLPNQTLSYKNLELDWSGNEEEEGLDEIDEDGSMEDTATNECEPMDKMQTEGSNNAELITRSETLWNAHKVKQIMDQIILF